MGAAPPSTVDAAPVPEPSVSAPTEEDGGFGDFDAAAPSTVDVPEPSVSTPTEEEDGFGDFDAAPPSVVDAAPVPEPSVSTPTEEDDGFGVEHHRRLTSVSTILRRMTASATSTSRRSIIKGLCRTFGRAVRQNSH